MVGKATSFRILSILLGVLLGLTYRVLWETELFYSGLVSMSFFLLVPFIVGFVVVYMAMPQRQLGRMAQFFEPWIAIGAFLLVTYLMALEGMICIVLALPGFVLSASFGGLLAGWLRTRQRFQTSTLCLVLIAPVLASPIEAQYPVDPAIETRTDNIEISASAELVWAEITNVPAIDAGELKFGLTRAMGIPRPVSARMAHDDNGLTRYTTWDDGISFREIIVESSENEFMTWKFDFPPGSVPMGTLDDHVRLGGKYFELLNGGYRITSLADGSTRLELTTSYRVSARPAGYAKVWANLVMTDFHDMILKLIRDRAEAKDDNS